MISYTNQAFAPIDRDHVLERIGGGNETEVYRTDDCQFVVKLKNDTGGSVAEALAWTRRLRNAADRFAGALGPEHSIPSYYIVTSDDDGRAQALVIQPFVPGQSLFHLDYATLDDRQRERMAEQLHDIIRRTLDFYRKTGSMPDLYGRSSNSSSERARLNGPWMLPWRMWSFLVERNLLRSHNLMLTNSPLQRVVLVDYDFVRKGRLYRLVYYIVRWLLFWRDFAHIYATLQRPSAHKAPEAQALQHTAL